MVDFGVTNRHDAVPAAGPWIDAGGYWPQSTAIRTVMNSQRLATLSTGMLAVALLAGCRHSEPTRSVDLSGGERPYANLRVTEPDFIVVEDFAVTPAQVRSMIGLPLNVVKELKDQVQSEQEVAVGRVLAQALKTELVKELKVVGLKAYPEDAAPQKSFNTGVIRGLFYEFDGANQTGQQVAGFGVSHAKISMRAMFNQREVEIANAILTVDTAMKLGTLPAGQVFDAAILNALQDDARRAAVRFAAEIQGAYKQRGWLK